MAEYFLGKSREELIGKDIAEISQEIVDKLEIVPVAHMDDVLNRALALNIQQLSQPIHHEMVTVSAGIVTH